MAYLRNSIGEFNFISLEGAIDLNGQQLAIDSRPGVTGMRFKLLASKGQPFVMISMVDTDSLFWANLQLVSYKALIESDPVWVWKNGVPEPEIKVLNVTKLDQQKISNAVGNKLSNQSGALLTCRWDLVKVPT